MGSVGSLRLAAETRLEDEAQRRVCEMRRVAMRGWPTIAMGDWKVVDGEFRVREAVWRMCVCGIDTVITMRRGGFGDGGAVGRCVVCGDSSVSRQTIRCFYNYTLVFAEQYFLCSVLTSCHFCNHVCVSSRMTRGKLSRQSAHPISSKAPRSILPNNAVFSYC